MAEESVEQVRPFSCGSQYGDWRSRNCDRCVKSYENTEPKPKDGMGPCAIDNAVGLAYIGTGSVTPEIAKRMGYVGENIGAFGWDCPERELAPEKPEPKSAPKELGVPASKKCAHTVPTFGCASCIENDRNAWAQKKYEEWKATYKPTKCPFHKMTMDAAGWRIEGEGLFADTMCGAHHDDVCTDSYKIA